MMQSYKKFKKTTRFSQVFIIFAVEKKETKLTLW